MIRNAEKPISPTTGISKAAILMIILGDQTSAEIFRELDEEEVQLLSREMARINAISSDHACRLVSLYARQLDNPGP